MQYSFLHEVLSGIHFLSLLSFLSLFLSYSIYLFCESRSNHLSSLSLRVVVQSNRGYPISPIMARQVVSTMSPNVQLALLSTSKLSKCLMLPRLSGDVGMKATFDIVVSFLCHTT